MSAEHEAKAKSMLSTNAVARHPVRCRCGRFRAELSHPERGTRAVCYCRDCQAFAQFLGTPPGMLDAQGGTDIVAVRPRDVTFLGGTEVLACMSLTERGTVRWYTTCCRTPIGNTPRDYRQSHVGLVHSCLEAPGPDWAASFGPVRMRINRHSAKGSAPGAPMFGFCLAVLGYLRSLLWSRLSGLYRINPFFDTVTGSPIVPPRVLSVGEHERLMAAV